MKIFKSILIILLINLIHSEVGVGFLTINMEGGQFNPNEFESIKKLLDFVSSDETQKDSGVLFQLNDANISQSSNDKNLDFIMISIQESDSSVDDLNGFNKLLDEKEWKCENISKQTGMISPLSWRSTIVSICHRNKFKDSYLVGENVIIGSTKYIGGYCYPIGDADYCFLGGHFPVKIDKGAELLAKAIDDIRMKIKKGRNFFAYVAGDTNTRASFEVKSQKVDVQNTIISDWEMVNSNYPSNNSKSTLQNKKWKADTKSVDKFKLFYSKVGSKKNLGDKSFVRFVGREKMKNLPFTYKYNGKQSDVFDVKKIFTPKESYEGTELFNIGWLDRMLCVDSSGDKHSCRIAERNPQSADQAFNSKEQNNKYVTVDSEESVDDQNRVVKYFLVPFLKKGDHMPVLGYIKLYADMNNNRSNNIKKKIKRIR